MSQQTALQHQTYQPFPKLNAPIIDDAGNVSIPWYRLLITLWTRSGGSVTNGSVNGTVQSDGNLQISTKVEGNGIEPIAVAQSPQIFAPTFQGTLIATACQVELSRNQGQTWFVVSPMGGAIPMLVNDWARFTWYGQSPTLTFLPGGA